MGLFLRNSSILLGFFIAILLSACSKDVDYVPPPGSTEMAINHYSYDKIVIDGEEWNIDLMILPNGKTLGWEFNRDTHAIEPGDFQDLITGEVKTVIVGTGYHGEGFLDNKSKVLASQLQAEGISVHVLPTPDAVNLFNTSPKQGLLTLIHVRY